MPAGGTHTKLLPMEVPQARVFALPGNAVFLVGPNMNQTSTQGEVNGEGLQQQKKSMKAYIQPLKV